MKKIKAAIEISTSYFQNKSRRRQGGKYIYNNNFKLSMVLLSNIVLRGA